MTELDLTAYEQEFSAFCIDHPDQQAEFAALRAFGFTPVLAARISLNFQAAKARLAYLEREICDLTNAIESFDRIVSEGRAILIEEQDAQFIDLAQVAPNIFTRNP